VIGRIVGLAHNSTNRLVGHDLSVIDKSAWPLCSRHQSGDGALSEADVRLSVCLSVIEEEEEEEEEEEFICQVIQK